MRIKGETLASSTALPHPLFDPFRTLLHDTETQDKFSCVTDVDRHFAFNGSDGISKNHSPRPMSTHTYRAISIRPTLSFARHASASHREPPLTISHRYRPCALKKMLSESSLAQR